MTGFWWPTWAIREQCSDVRRLLVSPVCTWPPVSLLLAIARQEVLVPFAFLMTTSLDDQMNSVALKAMVELWTCRHPMWHHAATGMHIMSAVCGDQGVWRVFTPGPATFGGRSLLWGLAVSRAFGDLLMKENLQLHCLPSDC